MKKMIDIRRITSSEFEIRQRVRGRDIFNFSSDKTDDYLKLSDFSYVNPGLEENYYSCIHGGFATELSCYNLNILSSYLITQGKIKSDMSDKHWELYNLKMYDHPKSFFGYIRPCCNTSLLSGWVRARVVCCRGGETFTENIYFLYNTLLSIIERGVKSYRKVDMVLNIPVLFPINIAKHTLPLNSLSILKPGVLIVPSEQNFSADGRGCFFIDHVKLSGVIKNDQDKVFIVQNIFLTDR